MLETDATIDNQPALGASKRRSCELVNTTFPCVKKALHHLTNLNVSIINASIKHNNKNV